MAGTDLAKLVVKLEAQNTQYLKKIDQSEKKVKRFQKQNKKALQGISGDFKKVLGGVAIGGLAVGVKRYISDTSKQIDQQAKFAQRIGISTEALGGLGHAAGLTGVSQQNLQLGLQRMTRRLAEAAQGTGEAKAAIKELGLEAGGLVKLNVDEQFIAIAGAMAGVENQSDRVRLAMKLFDSEGVALVNTLGLGEKGLRAARQEAVKYGIALNETDTKKIEAANDALTRSDAIWQGLGNTLTLELAPTLAVISEDFAETFNDPKAIQGIKDTAQAIGVLVTGLANLGAEYSGLGRQMAANAAAITGNLTAYDRLEQEIADVDRALKGGLSTPLKFIGVDDSELTKLRESLVLQQKATAAMSPFIANNVAELNQLDIKINETAATLAKALAAEGRGANQFGSIEAFNAQLDQLKARRDALLADAPTADFLSSAGAADSVVPGSEPPQTSAGSPVVPDTKALDAALAKEAAYLKSIRARGEALRQSVLTPNELYAQQMVELNTLLGEGVIQQDTLNRKQGVYKLALDESLGVTAQYDEALRILAEQVTPLDAELQALVDDQSLLNKAFRDGQISAEQFAQGIGAIDQKMLDLQDEVETTGENMAVFADQAARNIQDSLGGAINDLINGTEDWEDTFIKSLLNMVAQAAAADLSSSLSGGATGGGGSTQALISGAASMFGGFFAEGGRPDPYKISVVGDGGNGSGAELFIPDGLRGEIVPLSEQKSAARDQPVNVNAVTVLDAGAIAGVMSSPEMSSTFINQVRINKSDFRQALGLGAG
ncbi:MAG: hypothetical protein AB9Q22_10235 [Candidatus Reddybacter sp.]